MKLHIAAVWLASCGVALAASDPGAKIQALLDASPAVQRGFVGVKVVDLSSGETVFESNASRCFVPASNTKLFTTALGLVRLGPEHRFETKVVAAKQPDARGRVAGPVTLVGGGDPNLSGRTIPYNVSASAGDPLAVIEDLADQVVAQGVRRIEGDIAGDDTWYEWDPYPAGWGLDDTIWEYGAPVSALAVNDNTIWLTVGQGAPAAITLSPRLDYYVIDNRIRPGQVRKTHVEREPGSRQLRLWGTMPLKDPGEVHQLAIDDPALYAAMALKDALARRGVVVVGAVVARHSLRGAPLEPATGVELAHHTSAPLIEALRVTDKVSQNLHAEMILRAVAKQRRNAGTREAGLAELRSFLTGIGVEASEYSFHDGSGLSRMNLVTPSAVVRLLEYMYGSRHRDAWLALLPVGGEDGTLRRRMQKTAAAGRIHAKTGTLVHAAALSGYAERADGTMLAFSVLSNNQNAADSEVRAVVDKICVVLTE